MIVARRGRRDAKTGLDHEVCQVERPTRLFSLTACASTAFFMIAKDLLRFLIKPFVIMSETHCLGAAVTEEASETSWRRQRMGVLVEAGRSAELGLQRQMRLGRVAR
jgi:hypothetical protein